MQKIITVAFVVSTLGAPARVFAQDSGPAQTTTQAASLRVSFGDLHQVLKAGQTVVVTDESGQKTKGKVRKFTGSSLDILLVRGETRTFAEATIKEIRTADRLVNGTMIGLALGAGLGYLAAVGVFAASEQPGPAFLTWFGAGVGGALVGRAMDASSIAGPVVYASGRSTRAVTLAPLISRVGQGVRVSVLF